MNTFKGGIFNTGTSFQSFSFKISLRWYRFTFKDFDIKIRYQSQVFGNKVCTNVFHKNYIRLSFMFPDKIKVSNF